MDRGPYRAIGLFDVPAVSELALPQIRPHLHEVEVDALLRHAPQPCLTQARRVRDPQSVVRLEQLHVGRRVTSLARRLADVARAEVEGRLQCVQDRRLSCARRPYEHDEFTDERFAQLGDAVACRCRDEMPQHPERSIHAIEQGIELGAFLVSQQVALVEAEERRSPAELGQEQQAVDEPQVQPRTLNGRDDDDSIGDDDTAAGDDDSAAGDDDLGDDDSAFDVPDGPPPLPDDPITVGTVDNIEMNSLTPVESEAVAIGRDEDGLWAVGLLCTHLGCTIGVDSPDKSQISYAQGIECGCHGSEFTRDGLLVFGPANRALDCFLVSIGSSGAVTIDMQTEVDPGDRTSTDS